MRNSISRIELVSVLLLMFMFLALFASSNGFALQKKNIDVTLAARENVIKQRAGSIPFPLKITVSLSNLESGEEPFTYLIPKANHTLSVEYVSDQGMKTVQKRSASLPLRDADISKIRASEVSVQFEQWIVLQDYFDFSKAGIYRITFDGAGLDLTDDETEYAVHSNTYWLAIVPDDRYGKLMEAIEGNLELQLASYKFKNPPLPRRW